MTARAAVDVLGHNVAVILLGQFIKDFRLCAEYMSKSKFGNNIFEIVYCVIE